MVDACCVQILKGAPVVEGRAGATLPPVDFDKLKADLVEKHGDTIRDTDVMSAALYPKVFNEYAEFVAKYGPVDKLDTRTFLAGPEIEEEFSVSACQMLLRLTTVAPHACDCVVC